MRSLALEIILTACLLGPIYGLSKTEGERNTTLSNHGSHYLFKLDGVGNDVEVGKRNSRCTPCGHPDDRREVTNYLDPEYRGNGADNLGYDWSPWAWGGPAFKNRLNHQGRQYDGWDRGRGSRQMPGNWGGRLENTQPERFNCDRCKVIWERERGSRTNRVGENSFGHRIGLWHDDRGGFQSEIATVTSPPIALRPESRIAYVPSPGGEMYWDGISGGGTRWDGFSNGISWLGGGSRPFEDWRNDPRNRGYDQGPRRPEDYRNNAPGIYHRPWGNEPNKYFLEKGYGNRGPNMDHGMKYNGYASQWHYGITNQNGWNGNNMKWNYGGKNWDNRNGHGYYGGTSHGGKFDEDSNPLPHGIGGSNSYGPGADSSVPYGHGGPTTSHGQGGSSVPYGQGSIQYGQGGSVYYDQGNYIFHYGQGSLPHHGYHPSKYPQDGKPPSYPIGRPNQIPHPGTPRPSVKPWNYNSNDRYDNTGYSNINWVRPGPTEPGYPKPSSHGKYPFGGYDDKNDRKPWPHRPATGSYTPDRPNSGFPHGGSGYITGSVSHGGDRYSTGVSSQPSGYPGHGEYPGTHHKPTGFPGGGYNGPSGSSGYPGSGGSIEYPTHGESSGYPGHGSDSGYPGSSGGPVYPSSGGSTGYPGATGFPRPDHKPGGAGGYPNHRPGESGGYGRPEGGHKIPDRPGGYGSGPTPPRGYYMGFITEIDPNKYPNNVNIGLGGNRYPSGGVYPVRDKDPIYGEGQWHGNRYPGIDGDRYPVGGEGYSFGGSNHGGNRYPDDRDHRFQSGSSDQFPSGGIFDKGPSVGGEGNAWNYGPEGHKDGIYRRTGGSYPPYRGGPYYTSSYLASASTPAGVSQPPSEGKTQSVTTSDTVTKPTPEST